MRMAELSATSGVPVATIKYYVREGLLPQGERTSRTQATYNEGHVRRLRVIRALIDAGVGIAGAKSVLATLDEPPREPTGLLAAAHEAVAPFEGSPSAADLEAATALAERMGMRAEACAPERLTEVAGALGVLRGTDFEVPPEVMDVYLASARRIAEAEIANMPIDDPAETVRYVALGTALAGPLLLALRRLAEQAATVERFPSADGVGGDSDDDTPTTRTAQPAGGQFGPKWRATTGETDHPTT